MGTRFGIGRLIGNARGQALVTSLAAAVIVATTAAGTASLVQYLSSQRSKSQVLNRVVVLQSEVTAALLRKDQYEVGRGNPSRDLQIEKIRLGQSANNFKITNSKGDVIAIVGHHYGYDRDGALCDTKECAAYVDVDVRCGDANTTGCAAAYRVTPAPIVGGVAPPPLGAPLHNIVNSAAGGVSTGVSCGGVEGFACSDYSVPISYDYFTQATKVSCEGDDVMASGLNRATGKLQCVKKAATPCADGSIAHNVRATFDATVGSMRLEMDCHPLAHAVCSKQYPDDYVFERLGVQQLDLGKQFKGNTAGFAQPDGSCRYRWRNHIEWQTPLPQVSSSGGSVTASTVACNPTIYNAKFSNNSTYGGCGYQVTSQSPGSCPYSCNCSTDQKGNTSCNTCYSPSSSSVQVQQITINGATVACGISVSHSCGSTMTAHPTANGFCEVKEPFLSHLEVKPQWK